MTECVACKEPLTVEIELSDDEDVEMGESSANASRNQKVPDDVHLVRLAYTVDFSGVLTA